MSLVEFVRNNTHDLFNALKALGKQEDEEFIVMIGINTECIFSKIGKWLVVVWIDLVARFTDFKGGHQFAFSNYKTSEYISADKIFPYTNIKSARK